MILPPARARVIAKRVQRGSTRYTLKITGPAGSAVLAVTDPPGFVATAGQTFHVDAELMPGHDVLFAFRPIPAARQAP